MKRRYEIFVSSTFEDLKVIRKAIIENIIKLGHFPSAMEYFPTGPYNQEHIEKQIKQCDVFVILVGYRRGSESEKKGQSYLQFEFSKAEEYKKPILVFLLNQEDVKNERSKIPHGNVERELDSDVEEFRERVTKSQEGATRLVRHFKLDNWEKELLSDFDTSIVELINHQFDDTGGWIRSESYEDIIKTAIFAENVIKNPFFRKFAERLNKFDVLSKRCFEQVPDLKQTISEYFLKQYLGQFIDSGVRKFYFESGSSIAFLSEEFIKRLNREDWLIDIWREIHVDTNNILTYLDFVLSSRVQIGLFPYGSPEEKYGATFGPLTSIPKREAPLLNETPMAIPQKALNAVTEICNWFKENYRNGVIFMTVSGIELSHESQFVGPHVGSYYNKLFKQAILKSECPAVMFLDETKIPSPFQYGKCFPICDNSTTWENICSNNPLAMAIAVSTKEKAIEIIKIFKNFGLSNIVESQGNKAFIIIGSNEKFQSELNNLKVIEDQIAVTSI